MIAVEGLTKVYPTRHGPHVVLDNINFHINKGEKIGILGRNGAGKSTLIRLMSGAEYPSSGRIRRLMSVSWPLGYGGAFQANLTGFDNLRFICRVYGIDYASIVPFVEDFTELGAFLREPVLIYSSGMQARLAFALSLAIEFDCYLIDEAIGAGDSRFADRCRVELFEKRKDRSLILVSHDADTVKQYCSSAALLSGGRLHPFDNLDEAYERYAAATH
jgi:capsular polysaccharide transport system ATP-binding protein